MINVDTYSHSFYHIRLGIHGNRVAVNEPVGEFLPVGLHKVVLLQVLEEDDAGVQLVVDLFLS